MLAWPIAHQETAMSASTAIQAFNPPIFRRARREELAKPGFTKSDPYALLLACWVDYMRTDDRDLGTGRMKLVGEGVQERDLHEQQRAADMKIGESVNAMVDSLQMRDRWAIYKSQGIASAWRFPNARYEDVLMAAREELEKKLRNNLATRLYWA
jgi:hypothetical protein